MTLEELIERAIAGDGEAFTQLMEGQKQTLYKVARSYLHSDADAADAMGDTVLACWEKLPRTVLLLYYGEGFSTEEIAHILGLNRETVKTRLKRARAGFRLAYEAE